jgi:hypothetical protein
MAGVAAQDLGAANAPRRIMDSQTQLEGLPLPAEPEPQDDYQWSRREFRGTEGLRAVATELELAEVAFESVTCGGIEFPDERGVAFAGRLVGICTVSSTYALVQNRDVLLELAARLDEAKLVPWGVVHESPFGHMSAKVFFENPEYRMNIALGVVDQTTLIHLGLAIENSYGRPYVGLRTDCIGYAPQGEDLFFFSRIVGKASFRHVGRMGRNLLKALTHLPARSPFLARRIAESCEYRFDDGASYLALRGLGFGKRTATALVQGGAALTPQWQDPVTAWALYHAGIAFFGQKPVSEAHRDESRRRLERLLQTHKLDRLVKRGRAIVAKEDGLECDEDLGDEDE